MDKKIYSLEANIAYLSTSEVSKFEPGVITAPGVVALRRSCSYRRESSGALPGGPGPPAAVPEALRRGVCGWGTPEGASRVPWVW